MGSFFPRCRARYRLARNRLSHDQRDRAVIDDIDLHHCTENTACDGEIMFGAQLMRNTINQDAAVLRWRCCVETRPVALAAITDERELTDQQDLAADILYGPAHSVLVIGEYPQHRELASHPVRIGLNVGLLNRQQHAQPPPDAGLIALRLDRNRRLHNALNDRNHP